LDDWVPSPHLYFFCDMQPLCFSADIAVWCIVSKVDDQHVYFFKSNSTAYIAS